MKRALALLALPPQVPTLKVRWGGGGITLLGVDAHLPRSLASLFALDPAFILLEVSRVGISGVSCSIFNSHPFFCFSPAPEAGQLVASWIPSQCSATSLSEFVSHGKETEGRSAALPGLSSLREPRACLLFLTPLLTLPRFLGLSFCPCITYFLQACYCLAQVWH